MTAQVIVRLKMVAMFFICLSVIPFLSVYAQEGMQAANVRTVAVEIVPEPGSPVEITAAHTELGFDSFGVPVFGKTYIDYKNVGQKTITASKFRVRYYDSTGRSSTFQGNDESFVPPNTSATGKFAHYKMRTNIQSAKVRILAVKFSDGTTWESERMKEILKAQQEGREPAEEASEGAAEPAKLKP